MLKNSYHLAQKKISRLLNQKPTILLCAFFIVTTGREFENCESACTCTQPRIAMEMPEAPSVLAFCGLFKTHLFRPMFPSSLALLLQRMLITGVLCTCFTMCFNYRQLYFLFHPCYDAVGFYLFVNCLGISS